MTLKFNGKVHGGWLTNSHVVESASTASAEIQHDYDVCGVSIWDPTSHASKAKVQWMANTDIEATKDDINKKIKWYTQEREETE